jgi:F-type H+-transporting ATPase subunit alpha
MKKVAGRLRLDLAQFRELEAFAQFASDLDDTTRKQIERGRRTVEILKQPQYQPMPFEHQAAIIYAVTNGLIDDVAIDAVRAWEDGFHRYLKASRSKMMDAMREKKALEPEIEAELKEAIAEYKKTL